MSRLIKNKAYLALLIGCAVASLAIPSITFAATHIQASICSAFTAPVITAPASGLQTEAVSVAVKGTGESGMPVSIIGNGSPVGTTTVASDGTYAIEVSLVVGDNVLIARQTDNCTSEDSAGVTVHRISVEAPPENPQHPQQQQPAPPQYYPGSQPVLETQQPPVGSPLTPGQSTQPPSASGFPKPTIKHPIPGERLITEYIWVSGTAQPGSTVIIYVNNAEAARTVAADDGTYGARVILREGKNTIQVRAVDGGESAMSDTVAVQVSTPRVAPQPYDFLYSFILPSIALALFLVLLVWHIYRRRSKGSKA